MADIQKLTYPYFADGTTQLNAANLNPIIAKLNEVIDQVNSGVSPTPTQTVATPTISISGSTATISCSTSGATIYYTTNGNTPTTSSTQYSSPITLSSACTIKAIAVKTGMTNSSVASQSYTPSATPVVPTIQLDTTAKTAALSAASGLTIKYSTDGSTPTNTYSSPINVSNDADIKVVSTNGSQTSDIPDIRVHVYADDNTIGLDTELQGTIRYSTSGADPTSSAAICSDNTSIPISSGTIKAVVFNDSTPISEVLTINIQ